MPAISEMNFNAEVKSAVTRITLLHDILRNSTSRATSGWNQACEKTFYWDPY